MNKIKQILFFFKVLISEYKRLKKEKLIYKSGLYYNDINEIPLYNWWKCSKGEFKYLWRSTNTYIPSFFKLVFNNMYYQLDYIDLTDLRKAIESNYYESKYLTTKDIKYKRKADTKRAEIIEFSKVEKTEQKLNDIVKFVQITLNLHFQLDIMKISAGYFFNLYNDALMRLENGNN